MKTQKITLKNDTPFSIELRHEVNRFFKEHNLNEKGNSVIVIKTIIFMTSLFVLYALPFMVSLDSFWFFVDRILLGFNFACIGFNVVHDASHKAYSKKNKINNALAKIFDLCCGVSSYMWNIKHNQEHHSYPNTLRDDDLDTNGVFRFTLWQEKKWFHKFQTIYAIPFYCVLFFQWVFVSDFKKYKTLKVGTKNIKPLPKKEKQLFWLGKIIHFVLFLILPWMCFGFVNMMLGYLVFSFTTGLVISIVFQLAHVQSMCITESPIPLKQCFCEHQIMTTADFAANSRLLTFFLGGLNFQTVHHLFPDISHVHYKKIQPIIKGVCKKYSVSYHEYKNFMDAVEDHFLHLLEMSY